MLRGVRIWNFASEETLTPIIETRECGFIMVENFCQAAEMSEARECKSKLKKKDFKWLNGGTEMAQQFP